MQFVVEIIQENDFIPLADKAAGTLLAFAAYFVEHKKIFFTRRLYVTCFKEAIELEDFLDDHGARNNKNWLFFGELVASIRNLSSTAYLISHMLSRIRFYKLNSAHSSAFIKDANKVLDFFNRSFDALFYQLIAEAKRLGVSIPSTTINETAFEEAIISQVLPQDINDEGVTDIHGHVARIATEFINAANSSQSILFDTRLSAGSLDGSLIPDKINEETLRNFEAHMHNAQSMYDTYIQKTPFEAENKLLSTFRGHISITLHLLGVAKELSHFYERHETSVRQEATRQKISKIIQQKKVLHAIVNFALYYYTSFLKDGCGIAQELIEKFTITESAVVNIPEGLGFHLRPSTLVAKIVNHYGSKVTMIVSQKEFDAGSVIDIMWAGGMIKKDGVTEVTFCGDKNAVRDLKLLAAANYGEDTMGNATPLPSEISYLRQD